MTSAVPYFREVGTGPGVVCLHSNASSSAQWRFLMDSLASTHHVLAPDLYGAGKSPDWHSDRVITLADEAALIEPVLQRASSPFILVGHSHGAALALRIAVENPGRVRALALYEPTLFSLIEADGPAPNEADGIRAAVTAPRVPLTPAIPTPPQGISSTTGLDRVVGLTPRRRAARPSLHRSATFAAGPTP